MIETLEHLDVALFRFINDSLQNPLFDVAMPWVTDFNKHRMVLILVAVGLGLLVVKGKEKGRTAVALLVSAIVLSDQLNSSVIKYLLERPRPCHILQNIHLLVTCGSGFSFPSSHAVNNFCGATVLAFVFPRAGKWLFLFATVVAFSRVYVGVHYPSDVLAGAIVGFFCGLVVIAVFVWLQQKIVIARQRRPVATDNARS
jgi:undecaprenyl-diphosphatase